LTEVRRKLVWSDGEVQANTDHRPTVLRSRLDQNACQLSAVEPDVVWPLDHALDAGAECLGGGADCERDREWEQQMALVERAQDRRVEQGFAFGRGPDPPDASPTGGLFASRDHGASGRSRFDQLASAAVGRVGDSVVAVGGPERVGHVGEDWRFGVAMRH
jgi:hypothetical protein